MPRIVSKKVVNGETINIYAQKKKNVKKDYDINKFFSLVLESEIDPLA